MVKEPILNSIPWLQLSLLHGDCHMSYRYFLRPLVTNTMVVFIISMARWHYKLLSSWTLISDLLGFVHVNLSNVLQVGCFSAIISKSFGKHTCIVFPLELLDQSLHRILNLKFLSDVALLFQMSRIPLVSIDFFPILKNSLSYIIHFYIGRVSIDYRSQVVHIKHNCP